MLPLIHHAQAALNWFQSHHTVDATEDSVSGCDAFFLMGHHHLSTILHFAELYGPSNTKPIIISGGLGRGTAFIREELTHFLSFRNSPLPPNLFELSEAALIAHILREVGLTTTPALEEKARHSLENCTLSYPALNAITPSISRLAIVQSPTQRLRSLVTARSVFASADYPLSCDTISLNCAPLDLESLSDAYQTIHVFRLVGLRSKSIPGEVEILHQYYRDTYETIPDDVHRAYEYAANEFDRFIHNSPQHRALIEHIYVDDPAVK